MSPRSRTTLPLVQPLVPVPRGVPFDGRHSDCAAPKGAGARRPDHDHAVHEARPGGLPRPRCRYDCGADGWNRGSRGRGTGGGRPAGASARLGLQGLQLGCSAGAQYSLRPRLALEHRVAGLQKDYGDKGPSACLTGKSDSDSPHSSPHPPAGVRHRAGDCLAQGVVSEDLSRTRALSSVG
jgi:hypothetical protein